MHKSLDEFVFRLDPTTDSGVICLKNLCIMLLQLLCAFIFDWIIFILAGKEDSHKSQDESEFQPDPTSDCE